MIPALILFALGIADWLTTRSILAHGGYERVPLARWGMAKFGVTPFLLGKAVAMGAFGFATTLHLLGIYLAALVAAWYVGIIINNLLVLRRL